MTAITSKSDNVRNGLLFGLIIGLIYCISLFLRYNMVSSGVIMVGLITFLFYLVIIGMLVFCGLKRRKELGGYIELKDAFQTIFIAILIAELIYTAFNIIYLKFIDPGYFEKFQATMESFFEKTIKDDSKREEAIDKLREQMEKQKVKGLSFQGIIIGYLMWVAITGVFGFIVALIIRKKPPVFELDNPS